jgi:glycosyltransferase involved in cell wall biosynthesis
MKVLFDHPWPFLLAHGGFQIQIQLTKAALERNGVEVEHLRWWDDAQKGDLIYYLGRPPGAYIDFAHAKGMKVVVGELLSGLGSRSGGARLLQRLIMQVARLALPKTFLSRMSWDAYQKADGFVANTDWEAQLMRTMFAADPAKVHVVPNGVEEVFFQAGRNRMAAERSPLVSIGVIHPRKRMLELAQAAVLAKVPLWIIGAPYAEADPYYRRFLEVQKANPDLVRYEGSIADRARLAEIYGSSRGFALISTKETFSLSSLEACATGCPLLLSDLPWARTVFGGSATYASVDLSPEGLAPVLRDFYDRAPALTPTLKPLSWDEVGARFRDVFAEALQPREN